ncbi:unnamed protein product [Trichobilharzia regenti]|nr:unnamed protein product [Trichobilharzia regenti]
MLSQETRFNSSQRHYRLLAVIFHVGETVASGHYTIAVHISNHLIKNGENSTAFLYFDDDRACILNTPESVNLLLSTHRPLDTRSCTFLPLPSSSSSKQQQSRVDFGSTVNSQHTATSSVVYSTQPRTPYILVYESQTVYSPPG